MDDEKRSVIVFLKNEQKRASDALALAEQLATWAYAVYKRMRRGGCGNVYYTRELVYGGGSWDAVVRCGLHKRTTFGGLGLMLQAEVERHAAEWLRVLDAHMREHFEIPLGHACTSDVSFTTCVNIFASLIAKRVALLEDTRSDPSQLLCSRGCEHLARLQFLRCEFMAQRCIVSDIECMRTLVRLARNGAPPADEEGVQALLALLKKPPPELLSLLPSVASDMAFAPLRDALGTGAAPAALAAWREEVQCESLCMLLERAIATVQGWRPPPSGFLNALRYAARRWHMPKPLKPGEHHFKRVEVVRLRADGALSRRTRAHVPRRRQSLLQGAATVARAGGRQPSRAGRATQDSLAQVPTRDSERASRLRDGRTGLPPPG